MSAPPQNFRYSVAIRTLGQAGAVFQQELDSLRAQTLRPEKIVIYLAERYPRPKECAGDEEIVCVPKGMVAQRALPYAEIDSPYILLLDDDVYLPPDGVEKLASELMEHDSDCIAADTFANHKMTFLGKIRGIVTNWACPMYSRTWAIRIQRTGSFFYNNHPAKDCYLSQSAAGPCSLWRKQSFSNIHFEDELWMESIGFAYGDDLFLFYKLFRNGGRLLMHYTSGIRHLDAQTARHNYLSDPDRIRKRAFAWFLIWYRTNYQAQKGVARFVSLAAYAAKYVWGLALHMGLAAISGGTAPIRQFVRGNREASAYVHSSDYRQVPAFVNPSNKIMR